MNRSSLILPILAILVAVGFSSIFIVDEREKALVLQFGQVKAVKEEPGIGFKIPSSRRSCAMTGASSACPRSRSR